jgi:hypothetical protein
MPKSQRRLYKQSIIHRLGFGVVLSAIRHVKPIAYTPYHAIHQYDMLLVR